MKNLTLLLLISTILLTVTQLASAQKYSPNGELIYDFWIKDMKYRFSYKGYLTEVKEASLMLSLNPTDPEPIEIAISDINTVYFRPKGRLKRRVILGAVFGVLTGITTGIISRSQARSRGGCVTCIGFEEFFQRSLLFGSVGAGFGVLTGYSRVVIPIRGNQKYYQEEKEFIREFQYDY